MPYTPTSRGSKRVTSAQIARENNWTPGDVLTGSDGADVVTVTVVEVRRTHVVVDDGTHTRPLDMSYRRWVRTQ